MTDFLESLRAFLAAKGNEFNRDLIERVLEADKLEIQVNVRTDLGRPVEDKNARTDGAFKFYNIRYPLDAGSEPNWQDRPLGYPLEEYCDCIGTTGFSVAGSLWVGFDIDTIFGHASGHGVSEEQIKQIDRSVSGIPYVELRRSTRGQGRHIYVLLKGFDTKNHTEHAAVGRAVLGKVCLDAGLDFTPSVDACGSNLWFLSRKATAENRGYECLKPATRVLSAHEVSNWRDHLKVVQRNESTVSVTGLDGEFAARQSNVRKDGDHDRILEEYLRHGYALVWQPDHSCFQLHTAGLAKTHESLELRGAFKTVSDGSDPGKPNAFAFLRPKGAFFVVRYGTSTEHPLWSETANGQRCATFNVPLDPKIVCKAVEAVWTGKGFTCARMEQAVAAAKLFGIALPEITERAVNFLVKPDGILLEADRVGKEVAPGWAVAGRKLRRHFDVDAPPVERTWDDQYRHVVTPTNEDAGWRVRRADGIWGAESKDTLKDMLAFDGVGPDETRPILGSCAKHPWTLVNEPFEAEFLSGRRWNRGRKLLFTPSDSRKPSHPHFDMIIKHCGEGLDDVVAEDPWCLAHDVRTGADYLLLWAASLFQRPKHPLPYLFLFSPENNTGKSSYYRALGTLMEGGATDVHSALVENFNSQMAGAVLCYIEERTLNAAAYAKLKAWVDSPTISIREMRTNSYTLPNYAHFVQTANQLDACPIEPNDERIIVIRVPVLKQQIPWTENMAPALQREASDMLATLLSTPLPPATGRLFLPVLSTSWKREIMGNAEQADKRSQVVKALVERIIVLVSNREYWEGFGGNLLEAIGGGPWSTSSGTLVGYLQDAVDPLHERGVTVSISATQKKGQRQINIGQSWRLEPDWPASDYAEDDVRVARLQDEMIT